MSGIGARLAISLLLTLAVELVLAAALKKRGRDLLLVGLVNVATNPAAVFLSILAVTYAPAFAPWAVVALELGAILAEGAWYQKYGGNFPRPYWFSFAANALSFGIGYLIQRVLQEGTI